MIEISVFIITAILVGLWQYLEENDFVKIEGIVCARGSRKFLKFIKK